MPAKRTKAFDIGGVPVVVGDNLSVTSPVGDIAEFEYIRGLIRDALRKKHTVHGNFRGEDFYKADAKGELPSVTYDAIKQVCTKLQHQIPNREKLLALMQLSARQQEEAERKQQEMVLNKELEPTLKAILGFLQKELGVILNQQQEERLQALLAIVDRQKGH